MNTLQVTDRNQYANHILITEWESDPCRSDYSLIIGSPDLNRIRQWAALLLRFDDIEPSVLRVYRKDNGSRRGYVLAIRVDFGHDRAGMCYGIIRMARRCKKVK